MADKLVGKLSAPASITGRLSSGVTRVVINDHNQLDNRDLDDQHPISAITGLQGVLDTIPTSAGDLNAYTKEETQEYVEQNGGKIDTIKIGGVTQEIVEKVVDLPAYPSSTSELTNNGDGTSNFATEAYVEENGGKIDSISVNNVAQTIDENKNVNITMPTKVSDLTNDTGFITGINSTDVTTALGYTPYNATNPNGYQTASDVSTAISTNNTNVVTPIDNRVTAIEGKIPSAATSSNQLADKDFVNSSVSTATATYKGNYNLVSDLSLTTSATQEQIATALVSTILTADNNDYCFVRIPTSDLTPTQIARIDRYKYNGTNWSYEYSLNNSGFTAAQWAAINSGATDTLIGQISTNQSNISNLNTNKLDKVTSTSGDKRLYVINQDGTQTTVIMDYANTATGGHVPLRSSSGALMINDSTYSNSGQFTDGLQAINKNKLLERTTPLTGSSAPTTSTAGFVGQLYIDTTDNKTYQCIAITTENNTTTYTWVQMIRITDRGGYGTNGVFGVAGVPDTYGINFMDYGGARLLIVQPATTSNITNRSERAPITPTNLNFAVKSALTDTNHLTMTSNEQAVAQEVIGVNVLTGSGAPTTSTVGNIGQLYLDTSNDYKLYQCVAKTTSNDTTTYTWKEVVGGKIDSISIDDVALVIDASKNVNIPIAENGLDEGGDAGVVKLQGTHYAGIAVNPTTKNMSIAETTDSDTFWNNRKSYGFAVKASNLDKYLKLALGSTSSEADNTTTWTDTNKTNACNKIGASSRGIARL